MCDFSSGSEYCVIHQKLAPFCCGSPKTWVLVEMAEKEEAMHAVLKEAVDLVPNRATHFSVFYFSLFVDGIV